MASNEKVYVHGQISLIQINSKHQLMSKPVRKKTNIILMMIDCLGARRLVLNVEHFQTNYIIVMIVLSIYCV